MFVSQIYTNVQPPPDSSTNLPSSNSSKKHLPPQHYTKQKQITTETNAIINKHHRPNQHHSANNTQLIKKLFNYNNTSTNPQSQQQQQQQNHSTIAPNPNTANATKSSSRSNFSSLIQNKTNGLHENGTITGNKTINVSTGTGANKYPATKDMWLSNTFDFIGQPPKTYGQTIGSKFKIPIIQRNTASNVNKKISPLLSSNLYGSSGGGNRKCITSGSDSETESTINNGIYYENNLKRQTTSSLSTSTSMVKQSKPKTETSTMFSTTSRTQHSLVNIQQTQQQHRQHLYDFEEDNRSTLISSMVKTAQLNGHYQPKTNKTLNSSEQRKHQKSIDVRGFLVYYYFKFISFMAIKNGSENTNTNTDRHL